MAREKVTPLPVWEQAIYWVCGLSAILYGIYRLYLTSQELKPTLQYLNDSWEVLGGKKDMGDYEWWMYSGHLLCRMWPGLCVHIITSRLMACLRPNTKERKVVFVTVGAATACWLVLSWRYVTLLLATAGLFYVVSALRSVCVVWVTAVFFMYVCNNHAQTLTDALYLTSNQDYFIAVYLWASVFLRCTCFAIERAWSLNVTSSASLTSSQPSPSSSSSSLSATKVGSDFTRRETERETCSGDSVYHVRRRKLEQLTVCDRQGNSTCEIMHNGCVAVSKNGVYGWPVVSKVPGFLDLLVYAFYVPLLLNGPPVTFKSFLEQIDHPMTVSVTQGVHVVWRFLTIGLWFCFNNLLLHFLYFAAIGEEDESVLRTLDHWSVICGAYLLGQFLTNKYVVIYGSMRLTAALDGVRLADTPVCISYVYRYSDMWRSFDRGLYACLKRYIYVPFGGSHGSLWRSWLSGVVTFGVMGYWHGGGLRYMVWALLNFGEILLEQMGSALNRCQPVRKVLTSKLSAPGVRRLQSVLCYPLFIVATTSNVMFLSGMTFASTYLHTVCCHWQTFVTFGVVVYCMIQNSKHLQHLGLTKLS